MTEDYPHQPPVTLDIGGVRRVLGDVDAFGLSLLVIAMNSFGDHLFGDPETGVEPMDVTEVWAGLNEIYGTWVTEEGENRLNALITGMQDRLFYTDPDVFHAVCATLLSGDMGDIIEGIMGELTAVEVMWATLEMELANEDEDGPPEFSPAVKRVIDQVLRVEQEDHSELAAEVGTVYEMLVNQMRTIGVPAAALRLWGEEVEEVADFMAATDAQVSAI